MSINFLLPSNADMDFKTKTNLETNLCFWLHLSKFLIDTVQKTLKSCFWKQQVPNFFRVCVPEIDAHSYQIQLLRTEINKARTDAEKFSSKQERARVVLYGQTTIYM